MTQDLSLALNGSPDNSYLLSGEGIIRTFVYGGNATLTLRSRKTGTRFTYRVMSSEGKPAFVSLLTGPDTYTYLGTIFDRGTDKEVFRWTAKSRIGRDAPSHAAFAWFIKNLGNLPLSLEVWHEGRCGRCGRPLTDPDSIATGIGPICKEKM